MTINICQDVVLIGSQSTCERIAKAMEYKERLESLWSNPKPMDWKWCEYYNECEYLLEKVNELLGA